MPKFSPEKIAPKFSASESLSINPIIKNPALNSYTLFQPSMQRFVDLVRENQKIKEELKKLEEKIESDPKAHRYLNIINKRADLNQKLDENQRQLKEQTQSILANDSLLTEWRSLPQKSFELIQKQLQLAEDLAEEKINEEQEEEFKLINAEYSIFYSEPVRELYRLDAQAILQRGISESDLPYLHDLSQSDNTMLPIIKKEIDNYQTKKENDRENYWIEEAERRIAEAEQVQALRQRVAFTSSVAVDFVNQNELDEDKPLPPLYTADSAEAVYELLLNGGDPVKESQNLEMTPFTKHFSARYVIRQELNLVEDICKPSIKTQFNAKFGEKILRQHYSEDKKELKTDLNNQIQTLVERVERHQELKDLENQTKQLKLNLKNKLENQIKELKNEVNALTPELKEELESQYKLLKREAKGQKQELKNNAELIDAHIKGILLRDVDAQVSDYPDIADKKEFQQTWNNCKQEIKKLQQTHLTEHCTAKDFLTLDLDKLPAIEAKTWKSVIKQFPEYKPLLKKQRELLDNYRLVRGPQVAAKKEVSQAENTAKPSVKVPDVSETNIRETPEAITNEKISTDNNQLIQPSTSNLKQKNRFKYAFFNGSAQSTKSTLKKTFEPKPTGSRLVQFQSLLFISKNLSQLSEINESSTRNNLLCKTVINNN